MLDPGPRYIDLIWKLKDKKRLLHNSTKSSTILNSFQNKVKQTCSNKPIKLSSLIKFANIVGAKNSINFLKSNASKALDFTPSDPNDLINNFRVQQIISIFILWWIKRNKQMVRN